MRLPTFLILFIGANTYLPATQPLSQQEQDYYTGTAVGACVAVGCQVFRGLLLADPPKSGEPITFHVRESLFGTPNIPETVTFTYEVEANVPNRDGIASLADVWARAKLARNIPVTVVLGVGKGYGVHPGEPLIVTSNDHQADVIRLVVEDALRLQASPEVVSDLVGSLSHSANPARAGYLHAYLTDNNEISETELATRLLLDMLDSSSVPRTQVKRVVGDITLSYYRLHAAAKVSVVRRLTALGASPDNQVAAAAYVSLADIAGFDRETIRTIPPDTLNLLGATYRARVNSGVIKRNESFESNMGIKP